MVALAQDESFDWTRIIGALLVSASGIGFGVRFGFAEPLRWRTFSWLAAWRVAVALFIVVVLVAPVAGVCAGASRPDRTTRTRIIISRKGFLINGPSCV